MMPVGKSIQLSAAGNEPVAASPPEAASAADTFGKMIAGLCEAAPAQAEAQQLPAATEEAGARERTVPLQLPHDPPEAVEQLLALAAIGPPSPTLSLPPQKPVTDGETECAPEAIAKSVQQNPLMVAGAPAATNTSAAAVPAHIEKADLCHRPELCDKIASQVPQVLKVPQVPQEMIAPDRLPTAGTQVSERAPEPRAPTAANESRHPTLPRFMAQAAVTVEAQPKSRPPSEGVKSLTAAIATIPLPSTSLPPSALFEIAVRPEQPVEQTDTAALPDPSELVIERQLDLAQEGEWLDRLARDIARSAAPDGQPLRFRLNPEHLGSLRVEITSDRNGASVRFTADSEAARTIIADAQPRLLAEARAQGVRISETHVDLGGQNGSGDPKRQPAAFEEPALRTARLLQEESPSDGNPTPARSERYA